MCLGMGGGSRQPVQQELPERNAAPTVTGKQTGVDNPKDTKKATDQLMIKRQKEEGRYNPESTDTTTVAKLTSGGMTRAEKQARKDRQQRAKDNYNKRKYSKGIQGRKTGVA